MTEKIIQHPDPVLRQTAREIKPEEFGSPELKTVIQEMTVALTAQPDGVAIAAPQIGQPLKIFIISHRAWQYMNEPQPKHQNRVFINPQIIRQSRKKQKMDEGCLSVRWWYGYVTRSAKTRIEAYDENGQKFTHNGNDLISQIFQHEIDHLNGILFTDKASGLREENPGLEKTE